MQNQNSDFEEQGNKALYLWERINFLVTGPGA